MDKRLDEVSPPGWSGTTKAMKRHKDIDNPFALAWYMKNKKKAKPHYKPEPGDTSKSKKKPEKKEKYKHEDKPKKFKEWLVDRNLFGETNGAPVAAAPAPAPAAAPAAGTTPGQHQQVTPQQQQQALQNFTRQYPVGSQLNAQQATTFLASLGYRMV
jgi:hypothetical protein